MSGTLRHCCNSILSDIGESSREKETLQRQISLAWPLKATHTSWKCILATRRRLQSCRESALSIESWQIMPEQFTEDLAQVWCAGSGWLLGEGLRWCVPPLKGCIAGETTASFSLSETSGPCLYLVQALYFRSLCFLNKSSVICKTKVCCLFRDKKVNKSRDASW